MNTFPMLHSTCQKKRKERISRLSQKISIIRDEAKNNWVFRYYKRYYFHKICRNRKETRKVIKYNKNIKSINHKSYSHNENFEIFLILEITTKTMGINRASY
jgi:hypothetical protein